MSNAGFIQAHLHSHKNEETIIGHLDGVEGQLADIKTYTDGLEGKIDSITGAINNNNIGDGSLGARSYVYAHDVANGKAKALRCDTNGRLECSVDALEVTAETINLSTDTLEALGTATKNALFTNPAGSGNTIGENASAINSNVITTNSKLDTIIGQYTGGQTTAGVATAQNQAVVDLTLQGIDTVVGDIQSDMATQHGLRLTQQTLTNTKLDTINTTLTGGSVVNISTLATHAKQDTISAKLPSALTGSGNLKVCIQELGNEGSERLNTQMESAQLPTALTGGGLLKCSLEGMNGSGTGISTSALQTTANTHLSEIEGAVETIEGCVSGTSVNVIEPSKKIIDVAFMTNEDISATSYSSSVLDTLGYTRIQIMGEMNSGSVSGNSLMLEGSNASGGTYYHLGYLTNTTMGGVGGRTQFLDHSTSNGFGGRIYPRYLRIYNKTSGTINATLRAVMADFYVYQ